MAMPSKLEGWLIKKKGKDKVFSLDNRRWFKIHEVRGIDMTELVLSYFKSQRDKDAKSWIYLKDVTEIYEEDKVFTIVTPSRSITIEAETAAEHVEWMQTLVNFCPRAKSNRIKTNIKRIELSGSKEVDNRNNHNPKPDDKHVMSSSDDMSGERIYSRAQSQNSMAGNSSPKPDVDAMGTDDYRGNNAKKNNSGYSNRDRDPSPSQGGGPRRRGSRDDSGGGGGGGGSSAGSRGPITTLREDHRLHVPVGGDSSTNRLHKFISKEGDNTIQGSRARGDGDDTENQRQQLENNTAANGFVSRDYPDVVLKAVSGRNLSKSSMSNNSSLHSMADRNRSSEGDSDLDNEEWLEDGISGSNLRYNDSDSSPTSPTARSTRKTASLSFLINNKDKSFSKDDSSACTVTAASASIGPPAKKAPPPMPSAAPPRRARDGLAEIELGQSGGGGTMRKSIDDFLARKNSALAADAQAKDEGPDHSSAKAGAQGYKGGDADDADDDIDFKAELAARRRAVSDNAPEEGNERGQLGGTNGSTAAITGKSQPTSRPPRPPAGVKTPYSNPVSVGSSGNTTNPRTNSPHTGPTTPPRQSADPGSKVDKDFAHEDWDADNNEQVIGDPVGRFIINQNETYTGGKEGIYGAPQYVSEDFDRHHEFDDDEDDAAALDAYRADAKSSSRNSGGCNSSQQAPLEPAGVKSDTNWLEEDFDN